MKSCNTGSSAVFQHSHSPTIVLLLVYCPVDDTLFEVSPEIRCSPICQIATVAMEATQLVQSQLKTFLSQSMEN